MNGFASFVRKETLHIFRDPRTMLIALLMPVVQILLFGFALSTEVNNVDVAVVAPHRSETVRQAVERMAANPNFTFTGYIPSGEIDRTLRSGRADAVAVFAGDFDRRMADLEAGRPDTGAALQLVMDASNTNTAQAGAAYLRSVLLDNVADGVGVETRLLYNPRMKSAYNFVPGIMGLIFILICAIMTSVSIVREKETGTMEVLLVSPVRPIRIVFAKMIPYFVLSCLNLASILLLARFVLGVPMSGGIVGIVGLSLLYIVLALALGLFISTVARTQVTALLVSAMLMLMPMIMLSGMVFPIGNMPAPLRWLSCIVPARWYIAAIRRLMIEGLPFTAVLRECAILPASRRRPDRRGPPQVQRQTRIAMMRTLLVLLDKEFRQFFRNPFLPRMVVLFPAMVMLVMPWVTTMDIRHIGVAVVDRDHSSASRRIVQKIAASDYFTLCDVADSYAAALRSLDAGDADAVLEIPDGFGAALDGGLTPPRVAVSANGVDAVKGSLGTQYLVQTVAGAVTELRAARGMPSVEDPVVVENRYNPTLDYRHYMIPALMIMLLIMLCGFLPALNLVGEKETGTIEQINVTPVSPVAFTLAKLIPYWIIGMVVLTLAMALAWAVYGLLPAGSFGTVYLAALLFTFVMSGLGVIAANYSSTMQQAMFGMFFFVMIFVLMSGLVTPVESMPLWAQRFTHLLPPCYFVEIMRSVYLKGATVGDLWADFAALLLFALLAGALAALTYRKRS